jgi:hypothetical protein
VKYSFLVVDTNNDHPAGIVKISLVVITASNVVDIVEGSTGSTVDCVTNRISDPSDINTLITPLDVDAKALINILSTLDPLGPATNSSAMGPVPSNIVLDVNIVVLRVFTLPTFICPAAIIFISSIYRNTRGRAFHSLFDPSSDPYLQPPKVLQEKLQGVLT